MGFKPATSLSEVWHYTTQASICDLLCTVKPVLSGHSKRRPKIGFQYRLLLNAGQKYCRMLQGEHSAILSTFIKLPFAKSFVMSILEWPLKTGFTVYHTLMQNANLIVIVKFARKMSFTLCIMCIIYSASGMSAMISGIWPLGKSMYVVGTQIKRLNVTVLLSTRNKWLN